ncbi:hypothetical protein BH11CYA1_BH11CYA1_03420 [soil metagenome]
MSLVLKFATNILLKIQTGFMKQTFFALATIAVLSFNCAIAPEASAKDSEKVSEKGSEKGSDKGSDKSSRKSWANVVAGKTSTERWASIGKTAPTMLGMSRADVEKALGKGTYSQTQDELMYLITDDISRATVFDNVTISFGKDGKVKSFVIVTKLKD